LNTVASSFKHLDDINDINDKRFRAFETRPRFQAQCYPDFSATRAWFSPVTNGIGPFQRGDEVLRMIWIIQGNGLVDLNHLPSGVRQGTARQAIET
jgi:hypothetical protein